MEIDLWSICQGKLHIQPTVCEPWRVVEAQHMYATRKLVNSQEEYEILENLIERVKPPYPNTVPTHTLHYLLSTPFRYPPLAYGSRFGRRFEPSLWYGSLQLSTAFSEFAFYRFVFLHGCAQDLGLTELKLSTFQAVVETKTAIQLTQTPFSDYRDAISSPTDYSISQSLGNAMRNSGIDAFYYFSARAPYPNAINIALFTPKSFASTHPKADSFQTWQCFADREQVELMRGDGFKKESYRFSLTQFLINNILPMPAE